MPYTRRVNRPARAIERPRFYKPNSNNLDRKADNIINEAFNKNMNELANKHKEAQEKQKSDNIQNDIKCATCRNADSEITHCYYAARHPSDKQFKTRAGIPINEAILNCFGYEARKESNEALSNI